MSLQSFGASIFLLKLATSFSSFLTFLLSPLNSVSFSSTAASFFAVTDYMTPTVAENEFTARIESDCKRLPYISHLPQPPQRFDDSLDLVGAFLVFAAEVVGEFRRGGGGGLGEEVADEGDLNHGLKMLRVISLNPKTEIEPRISRMDTDQERVMETIFKPVCVFINPWKSVSSVVKIPIISL